MFEGLAEWILLVQGPLPQPGARRGATPLAYKREQREVCSKARKLYFSH